MFVFVFVFVFQFVYAFFLCGVSSGALLYESPGGNQVDGLPPALNTESVLS